MRLGRDSAHVVFVEPEIHWNTGNAGRTCLAVDAQLHLVKPLGFSLGAKEVKRAGLDYWPQVAPVVWETWSSLEIELPSLGQPVFFSAEAERDYTEADYRGPTVLIFGRESVGLSPEIRAKYREHLVRIPQLVGSIRSLNVSTCVGIALYEMVRQRKNQG